MYFTCYVFLCHALGTWVLTQGTHVGVAKLIGMTLKEYITETGSAKLDDAVLLGIANYQSVTGKEALRWKEKKSIAARRATKVNCGDPVNEYDTIKAV